MIDAHCHIDLYDNPLNIARMVEERKISTIAVTNLPSHFEQGYGHLRNFRYIRLALGLHPLYTHEHTDLELRKFILHAEKTSYIGEIGLDFSRHGIATRDKQVDSFRFVLSHIRHRPKFVSLHSRKAEHMVLHMLDEYSIKGAVFHWYSGPLTLLTEIARNSHYFSVNPAMLNSTSGRKIIERIPRDRLLTETDGPFTTVKGQTVTSPDISRVLEHLCSVWNCTYEEAERQVEANFDTVIQPIKNQL